MGRKNRKDLIFPDNRLLRVFPQLPVSGQILRDRFISLKKYFTGTIHNKKTPSPDFPRLSDGQMVLSLTVRQIEIRLEFFPSQDISCGKQTEYRVPTRHRYPAALEKKCHQNYPGTEDFSSPH
jgi:hypothetical protein